MCFRNQTTSNWDTKYDYDDTGSIAALEMYDDNSDFDLDPDYCYWADEDPTLKLSNLKMNSRSETINMIVTPSTTLASMKVHIYETLGVPMKNQKWIFNGKTLTDDTLTLEEYGVDEQKMCDLVLSI